MTLQHLRHTFAVHATPAFGMITTGIVLLRIFHSLMARMLPLRLSRAGLHSSAWLHVSASVFRETRVSPGALPSRGLRVASLAVAMLGCAFAGSSRAETISLYELARFDLSLTSDPSNSAFIGTNPIAVGWNGTKLYVAGFNSGTTTTNTAIIEITNASGIATGTVTGFVTPTYSSTLGSASSGTGRGYTGLAMKGNQLAASFDAGSNSVNGIQMFNATTNARSWNLTASGTSATNVGTTRGMTGPDFDPGYLGNSGLGSGLGWTTQGVGRRLLNDSTTGTTMYSATANVPTGAAQGGTINTDPASTTWRDMAFDPATGDIYMRNQRGVTRANRTGANAFIGPTSNVVGRSEYIYINSGSATSNNVGINIGFMNSISSGGSPGSYAGDALVFNDRGSTAAGQTWTNVIKFTTTSGSSITPNYTFLSDPATSTGAYDFEWDSATQTLAILDYSNRTVSIFSTAVPEPSTWAMLTGGAIACGGAGLRRRMQRRTGSRRCPGVCATELGICSVFRQPCRSPSHRFDVGTHAPVASITGSAGSSRHRHHRRVFRIVHPLEKANLIKHAAPIPAHGTWLAVRRAANLIAAIVCLFAALHADAAIVQIDLSSVGSPLQDITGENAGMTYDQAKRTVFSFVPNGDLDIFYQSTSPSNGIGLDGDLDLVFAIISSSARANPRDYSPGEVIDGTAIYSGTDTRTWFYDAVNTPPTASPDFGPDSFMGFRFGPDGNRFYGYIEVLWHWTGTPSTSTFQLLSAAYESQPNTGIAAPTSAVPEIDPARMGSVLALVTGALGLLERRRLKIA